MFFDLFPNTTVVRHVSGFGRPENSDNSITLTYLFAQNYTAVGTAITLFVTVILVYSYSHSNKKLIVND